MNGFKALKLRADDDEDLAVIAACLHGAICCLGEMAYDREVRRFAAILVRPLWELAPKPEKQGLARMRAGLHFDHVAAVRYRRFDRQSWDELLNLVSIVSAPISKRFGIILSFQGGSEVFLEVDRLNGHLQDLDAERREE